MPVCRFCGGYRGCLYCPPKEEPVTDRIEDALLLRVRGTPEENPEGWRLLREVLGRGAVEHAFGPGGGGIDEIRANIERARARDQKES